MQNSKWLAVLINLVFPGFGYIYVGERIWFGILIAIAGITDLMWRFVTENGFAMNAFLLVSWASIYLATTLDVYFAARDKVAHADRTEDQA